MKRKVNRVGQNTLTVSLPVNWVRKQGLNAGDELDIAEEGSSLIIRGDDTAKKIKKATLNLDNLNKMLVTRYIHEFYRLGAEEMILTFTNDTLPDYKSNTNIEVSKHVKALLDRFIGLEIVSQTNNKIVLQSLMKKEESDKIDVVQMRVFFLVKEFLDEFLNALDGDFAKFHSICYDYHDNITRFTSYYYRLLNTADIPDNVKSRLLVLFSILDHMIDKVRHTSERVSEMKKITDKTKTYLRDIFTYFIDQFDMIFKKGYSPEDVGAFIKRRYKLVQRVNSEKFTESELRVMMDCRILLDTILQFTEAYVSLNIEKCTSLP